MSSPSLSSQLQPQQQQQQQQSPPPGSVDITTLTTPQLSQLQSRLSEELQHLTSSHARLRAAQSRFRDCIRSIQLGLVAHQTPRKSSTNTTTVSSSSSASSSQAPTILVPLTTSLYVPGQLASPDTVLVDVGTGFYVEKKTGEALTFYEGKVKGLDGNLGDIEKMVGAKEGTLRVVEEVLREKVLAEQRQGQGQGRGPEDDEDREGQNGGG